jgi:hypothetical protein
LLLGFLGLHPDRVKAWSRGRLSNFDGVGRLAKRDPLRQSGIRDLFVNSGGAKNIGRNSDRLQFRFDEREEYFLFRVVALRGLHGDAPLAPGFARNASVRLRNSRGTAPASRLCLDGPHHLAVDVR